MGFGGGGGAAQGVSGRMGEQGGLRTGWLAAFGTEGYEGEPPLLEELGVNFGHIKGKVRLFTPAYFLFLPTSLPPPLSLLIHLVLDRQEREDLQLIYIYRRLENRPSRSSTP